MKSILHEESHCPESFDCTRLGNSISLFVCFNVPLSTSSTSLSQTSSLKGFTVPLLDSGSLDLTPLPNIKEKGMVPVVACRVDLFAVSYVTDSKRQFFFFNLRNLETFQQRVTLTLNLPLTSGRRGVVYQCSMPNAPVFGETFQTLRTQTEAHCLSTANKELQTEQIWDG